LRPDIYSSLDDFGNRYCQLKQNQWTFKMQFEGSKNSGELHYLLKKTVMIRRLKNDVLSQLPPKQRQIVMMET
jgi:SWI/SNF-related matrix-associated actin-dependent regulator 1 of chromatin subfamily A